MKIALLGSAPSSVQLAPYHDASWAIWACSPGAHHLLKRVDAFFEIHRWEPDKPWFSLEYIRFMAMQPCPVYMIEPVDILPNSRAYPKDEMVAKYGPFFFTSTLSWMFAMAIEAGATEIGLWGVDMSAQEEWFFQRSGCHYFIEEARKRGIKITIPHESDLLRPPPLYGFCEVDPLHIKLLARERELRERIARLDAEINSKVQEKMFIMGALDDTVYMQKTWVADRKAIDLAYANPPLLSPSEVLGGATPGGEAIIPTPGATNSTETAAVVAETVTAKPKKLNGHKEAVHN